MRLIQGDCLEVMKQLTDEGVKVDLVLTDPPYGTTNCKWDSIIPFNEMWDCLDKLTNFNTPILLFGSEPFSTMLRGSNINNYKYDWIWEKEQASNFLNSKKVPLKIHEVISMFYNKSPTYNPQYTKGTPYTSSSGHAGEVYGKTEKVITHNPDGKRYPVDIIKFQRDRGFYPTQKPVKLLEYLIKTYTNPGDLVLDFTMGSGSTGVACYNTGRDFIGIELDEEYFKVASDRIKKAMGQSKLHVFNKNKVKV